MIQATLPKNAVEVSRGARVIPVCSRIVALPRGVQDGNSPNRHNKQGSLGKIIRAGSELLTLAGHSFINSISIFD